MDAKMVGKTIAALRKSLHITQAELARQLCISDKAISKWESGQGFPDITQFPELARILNVSIDYLMTGRRNVITIVGNIITDLVKTIDFYPNCGMLTYINGVLKNGSERASALAIRTMRKVYKKVGLYQL